MYQKNHVGSLKETVVLQFTNGYQITLEAGVEMSMCLTMGEQSAQQGVQPTPPTASALRQAFIKNDDGSISYPDKSAGG